MPRILSILLIGLLAGCQLTGPGKSPDNVTPNAVTGSEIAVTALDDPAPPAAVDTSEASEAAVPVVPASEGEPTARTQSDPATPEPEPEVAAEPAPQPDAEAAVPETAKSEQQRACERKGGTWSRTGTGDFRICVYKTRDAGKQCTRESQCDGVCLARSGTCSPIKPLIGCNEVLQDNGARVTLCIE